MAPQLKRRLLYSFPRIVGRPGVGTAAFHEIEGLLRMGWEVFVAAKEFDAVPAGAKATRTMPRQGIRIPARLLANRENEFHDRRVARMLGGVRPDLVLGWPGASLATLRGCQRRGVPFVLEVPNAHAVAATRAVQREEYRLGLTVVREPDLGPLAKQLLEYDEAGTVLVASEVARQSFLNEGASPDALVVHRYGCDIQRFCPRQAEAARDDGLQVLFAARVTPRKGLHVALQAWHQSGLGESGRFVVVGDIRPDYRRYLASMLDHPSVETVDYQQDVRTFMSEADVFVLPSVVAEGSALVSYEAQAAGCVLLASEAGGALMSPGVHGLLHTSGDVDQLAGQLTRLGHDRDLLDGLRRTVLADRERLSWAQAAAVLTEVLETRLR